MIIQRRILRSYSYLIIPLSEYPHSKFNFTAFVVVKPFGALIINVRQRQR